MAFNSSHLAFYLAYLSGIPSGMSSDILSRRSSDILSGISFGILFVISSDILSGISSTSSTAVAEVSENRKPTGEVGCCESRMAERIH